MRQEADAQEVLQDVFIRLLQKPDQYRGQCSITTYLYSVTTHVALSKLRDRRTRLRLLDERAERSGAEVSPRGQARIELRELLATLPDELAQVAVYHYLDEMTHEEIAKTMGCSRQWVTKLAAKLRRHPALQVDDDDAPLPGMPLGGEC